MADTNYANWIGRSETVTDVASASQIAGLRALLDDLAPDWPAGLLPPLGHWLHFLPHTPQSAIDRDGHPLRGGLNLIPAIALPRRMWAGGRIRFEGAIALGAALERRTTILKVTPKSGQSGNILFVTLGHEIASGGRIAIREEQDIVYRDATASSAASIDTNVPAKMVGARRLMMGPVELFRYSALTFNAHRIHYDRDYARTAEGYPGLVVHGPLTATLSLAHFLRERPDADVCGFSFRAERPLYEGETFDIVANDRAVTVSRPDGGIAMRAEVEIRS